jgi:polyphenol oxidase
MQMSSMSVDAMSGAMAPSTRCAPANQDVNALIKSTPMLKKDTTTVFSTEPLTFRVRNVDPSGDSEEVLVFSNVAIDWTKPATINAYLFYPEADGTSLDCMEFFGTFAHVPSANHRKQQGYTRAWRLGLSAKLEQLGLTDVSHVVVTLVQVRSQQTIRFSGASVVIDNS